MNHTVFAGMLIGSRNRQEDCILDGATVCQADRMMTQKSSSADPFLACVCDGLGGHAHGEAASRFVCEEINARFPQHPQTGPPVIRKMLAEIQQAAQQRLPETAGTTVAGIMIAGRRVIVFNAGDSRVYRISSSGMMRLSHDHSLVQDLVDSAFIHKDKASEHPLKNILGFGMGPLFAQAWNHLHIRIHEETPDAGACYLICSDGLNDMMTEPELYQCLMPDPIKNGKTLFDAALAKELTDNTSFVIVKFNHP